MKYYYNIDSDKVEPETRIQDDYRKYFSEDYDTYGDYLSACMVWNNGSLRTMESHIRRLETELTRYAGSYEPEEIREKQEEISLLRRMYMEV